jgi:3-dehydroquinate synthase
MQKFFNVQSLNSTYKVTIGSDLLGDILSDNPDAIYIVDDFFEARLSSKLKKVIFIEAVEGNKSLEKMSEFIARLRDLNATRETHIISIGGGIIQDITTFVASIYMRGLTWTYLPTTLLGMSDSCIGGKSSINAAGYKNLVGNFYTPDEVIIDTQFIETLSDEMVVGGLYEASKICFAHGKAKFEEFNQMGPAHNMSAKSARDILHLSLLTKKWFIETDEFDKNERLLLNYGHTFGHALEAASDFSVSHGIGVGAGMLIAGCFARHKGILNETGTALVSEFDQSVMQLMSKEKGQVCDRPPVFDLELVLQKFRHDKKHEQECFKMILPVEAGGLQIVKLSKSEDTVRAIKLAFEEGLSMLEWPYQALTPAH